MIETLNPVFFWSVGKKQYNADSVVVVIKIVISGFISLHRLITGTAAIPSPEREEELQFLDFED